MAKDKGKGKKDEAQATTPKSPHKGLADYVKKDFGEGVLIPGTVAIEEPQQTISISPSLDIITGGGILPGSFVGITGNPKTGKTSMALSFAANCQLPEFGSRPIYYGKVEGRLSIEHLQGIKGLDLHNFNIIQSREGKILSAQDFLRIFDNIITNIPRAILIIDSISALCDQKEMDGGVGTETRGSGAKLFSQFLSTMSNVVPVNKSIVLGITHMMCNTGGMGPKYLEKASRRWHYQCDYQLRTLIKKNWMAKDRLIGFQITWKNFTTPRGLPLMQADSYLRFGTGVDRLFEALNYGKLAGLIGVNGSWLTLQFLNLPQYKHLLGDLKEAPQAQGAEAVYQMLDENQEWARALETEVVKIASGFGSWGGTDEG